jgi:hypothetical protein
VRVVEVGGHLHPPALLAHAAEVVDEIRGMGPHRWRSSIPSVEAGARQVEVARTVMAHVMGAGSMRVIRIQWRA